MGCHERWVCLAPPSCPLATRTRRGAQSLPPPWRGFRSPSEKPEGARTHGLRPSTQPRLRPAARPAHPSSASLNPAVHTNSHNIFAPNPFPSNTPLPVPAGSPKLACYLQGRSPMSSQLQIEANRRNSQKSTGPRTAAGKAIASQNALGSGIYAESETIRDENASDLDSLAAAYYARFHPAAPEQRCLVDILVHSEWTLRRLRRAEAQLWDRMSIGANPPSTKTSTLSAAPSVTTEAKSSPAFSTALPPPSATMSAPSRISAACSPSPPSNSPSPNLNPSPPQRPPPSPKLASFRHPGDRLRFSRQRKTAVCPQVLTLRASPRQRKTAVCPQVLTLRVPPRRPPVLPPPAPYL